MFMEGMRGMFMKFNLDQMSCAQNIFDQSTEGDIQNIIQMYIKANVDIGDWNIYEISNLIPTEAVGVDRMYCLASIDNLSIVDFARQINGTLIPAYFEFENETKFIATFEKDLKVAIKESRKDQMIYMIP